MITRNFNLFLNAGKHIPLVINVNQYDHDEQWCFTLLNDNGEKYIPSTGAIVGIKADRLGIINSGTVNASGQVVINETEQMTAAVGKAVFELLIDDQTHGTANFAVLVEPKPGNNADFSESDLSLLQEAIDGTSAAAIAEGVGNWMDDNLEPGEWVIDSSLTVQGAAADAKKTGDEISDLKSQIAQSSGVPVEVKQAISALLSSAMYSGSDMADEKAVVVSWASQVTAITLNQSAISISGVGTYQLIATTVPSGGAVTWSSSDTSVATVSSTGLVTSVGNGTATITAQSGGLTATCTATITGFATVTSISAVYTQGGTVYATDSLDSLKEDLVVTAYYSDSTSQTVTGYTLSGTLTAGTLSTITVTYSGQTDTFEVDVYQEPVTGWYYPFNGSLLSAGTKDFGFTGQEVYGEGRNGKQAYYHIIPTSGDATSDTQLGLKAVDLTDFPNLSGDFTISYWFATQVQSYQHPLWMVKWAGSTATANADITSATFETPWSGTYNEYNSKKSAGIAIQGTASDQLVVRVTNSSTTRSTMVRLTIPNNFDTTSWHHYALTKKGTTLRLFVDGTLAMTATLYNENIYASNQIAVLSNFDQSSESANKNLVQIPNGGKMQDLYIVESCKWESDFDPDNIVY